MSQIRVNKKDKNVETRCWPWLLKIYQLQFIFDDVIVAMMGHVDRGLGQIQIIFIVT